MNGYRKTAVIILYMLLVTIMSCAVVKYRYDSLSGVAMVAGAMATGLGSFMWGNAKEHQAEAIMAQTPSNILPKAP